MLSLIAAAAAAAADPIFHKRLGSLQSDVSLPPLQGTVFGGQWDTTRRRWCCWKPGKLPAEGREIWPRQRRKKGLCKSRCCWCWSCLSGDAYDRWMVVMTESEDSSRCYPFSFSVLCSMMCATVELLFTGAIASDPICSLLTLVRYSYRQFPWTGTVSFYY